MPFDAARARRTLARYLGPEPWDPRFIGGTFDDPAVRFVRLAPQTLRARDLSFQASG